MDIQNYIGLAGLPLVVGLVEILKRWVWPECPTRFWPLWALAFALAINIAAMPYSSLDLFQSIIIGLVVGMGAVGGYSGVRAVAGN